jgi:hypothetical protein
MGLPYTYMTTKYFTLKTITKANISKWLCDVHTITEHKKPQGAIQEALCFGLFTYRSRCILL